MKKSNISKLFLALICCSYLFVCLIAGIITEGAPSFWVGFGFLTFGAVIALAISLIYGNGKTTIRDVYFNAPIYYIGIVYYVISGIVSVLHMLFGLISFKWLLIVQMINFAIFAVYFIFAMISKTNAENVIQKVADKNHFIRNMTVNLNAVAESCNDRETKIKLEALAEEMQYSKPASYPALEEIEADIKRKVAILDYQIGNSELVPANETIVSIRKSLVERNRIAQNVK